MQVTRTLPPYVADALTDLPSRQGLGPFVGITQVNSRNPDKIGQPAAVAAIGLGLLSIAMSAVRMLFTFEAPWVILGLVGIGLGIGGITAYAISLGRAQSVGDEFVAVHERGFVWAGTGTTTAKVFRYDGSTVKHRRRTLPVPKPDEARAALSATFRSGKQKFKVWTPLPEEQAALGAILTRMQVAGQGQSPAT